jgi:heme-degrading monooxygenase HmoA
MGTSGRRPPKGPALPLSRLLFVLAVLAPIVAAQRPTAAPASRPSTAVLELAVDPTGADAEAAAKAAAAFDAALARRPGVVRTDRIRVDDETRRFVRATIFASREAVEDAALAADGAPESEALRAATGEGGSTSHFRLLAEAVYRDAPGGHFEVVVFRTKPGDTRDAHLARFTAAEADFAKVGKPAGLDAHSLWIAADGRYVHLLRWRSAADYVRTGKSLMRTPGVGGWIKSLDFRRFVVTRGDVPAAAGR